MKLLNIESACDYLESSVIEKTVELGHAIVHYGVSEAGHRFVLIHDWEGDAVVSEAL